MTSTATDNVFLTLPIAIISAIITLITCFIAIFTVHHFLTPEKDHSHDAAESPPPSIKLTISPTNSQATLNTKPSTSGSPVTRPTSNSTASETRSRSASSSSRARQPKKIFRYLSSAIVVFNSLNTAFNTVYCVWLVMDPPTPNEFYVSHPSHIHRVTATVSWYLAKVLFVWMLSFRLYHSFKGSIFRVNKKFILFLSITNSIVAPVGLCVAYWAVYDQRHPIIAEFAFNVWRILYQIIVFIILYMFCKRLLQLIIDNEMFDVMKAQGTAATLGRSPSIQKQHSIRISNEFLEVITRHSLLVLTVSVTVAMTTFCFFGFRFIFLPQTCMTLLIPMNMAAVDSLITSICVLCLFPVGERVYSMLCHVPNACLKRVCLFFAKRTLTE